jgi:FkbM family methyltransferase
MAKAGVMQERSVFKIDAEVEEGPQRLRVVGTRYGALGLPEAGDELVSQFLTRVGEWAWDETAFLAEQLPDGARVLDGGAFLGTFGLGVDAQKRLSFLCAVEPNEAIAPVLESNLGRNARGASIVHNAMLSGQAGAPRVGRGHSGNLGSISHADGAMGGISVPMASSAITLESLRERHGHFDLIKLDVEGMELEVLLGDAAYLSQGKSMLWVECSESIKSLQVAQLLLSWELELYYFAFPSHNPENFHGAKEPILPWAYEAGLLAAPRTAPVLNAELAAHGCILRPIRSCADLEDALWFTPRWLPSELAHAGPPQLAAVASRALQGQARIDFLSDTENAPKRTIWEQLATTRAGLARAEALAASNRELFGHEARLRVEIEARATAIGDQLAATQARLAETEERAASNLEKLEREIRFRHDAETRAAGAVSLSLARLEQACEERRLALVANKRAAAAETCASDAEARAAAAEMRAATAEMRGADAEARAVAAEMRAATAEMRGADAETRADALECNAQHVMGQLHAVQRTFGYRLHVFMGRRFRVLARVLRALAPSNGRAS